LQILEVPTAALPRPQLADRENARQQHDIALEQALVAFIKDHTEFYKQFKNSPEFHRFVAQTSFESTYNPPPKPTE